MDGYISHSFGPQSAERHLSYILKSNAIPASYHFGADGGSFVVNSPNQPSRVLDRRVLSIGSVVPQILWVPHTVIDRRQHVQDAELQMPIFFQHTDGRLGLTLKAAVGGRCHTFLNSQCSAPLGPLSTMHIRIGVSEYFLNTLVDFEILMRFRDTLVVAWVPRVQATGTDPRQNSPAQYGYSVQVRATRRAVCGCFPQERSSGC